MTLDTPLADAARTRRDSRRLATPTAPESSGVLTRAEYRRLAAASALAIEATPAPEATPAIPATPAADLPADSAFAPAAEPECVVDEFEFAARLFSFTGETPVQAPAAADDAVVPAPVAASDAHRVQRRSRARAGAVAKRLAAASFSVGVMAIVGLLAVGTTTPAAAVASASETAADLTVAKSTATKIARDEIQAFVASSQTGAPGLDRTETYDVASMADVAADSGVTLFADTWVNNSDAPIQWPFPVGVPISAAYGSVSYLSQFASPHRGVDLTPGAGAEVHAVAAGTVRIATEAGGDYGVTVLIDHIIDGQLVSTRYGHMQYGSLRVEQGEQVTAGQVLGKVGETGKATGPHLHLEVLLNGTTHVDPMPWLFEHTTGSHTVG